MRSASPNKVAVALSDPSPTRLGRLAADACCRRRLPSDVRLVPRRAPAPRGHRAVVRAARSRPRAARSPSLAESAAVPPRVARRCASSAPLGRGSLKSALGAGTDVLRAHEPRFGVVERAHRLAKTAHLIVELRQFRYRVARPKSGSLPASTRSERPSRSALVGSCVARASGSAPARTVSTRSSERTRIRRGEARRVPHRLRSAR